MRNRIITVIGVAILVIGCSHTHSFNPDPKIDQLAHSPLAGKRLALDLSQTPEIHNDSANGHRFQIVGIREHARSMTTNLFGSGAFVERPEEADVVLALQMDIEISTTFSGTKCTCLATWEFKNPAGNVLAVGEAEHSAAFPTIGAAGNNCELSALQAIAGAMDNGFAKLPETLPSNTREQTTTTDIGQCKKDTECPGDLVCNQGTCQQRFNTPPTKTTPAAASSVPAAASAGCTKDMDCPGTLICNRQGRCVEDVKSSAASPPVVQAGCGKDTDCKGERICENRKCVFP